MAILELLLEDFIKNQNFQSNLIKIGRNPNKIKTPQNPKKLRLILLKNPVLKLNNFFSTHNMKGKLNAVKWRR